MRRALQMLSTSPNPHYPGRFSELEDELGTKLFHRSDKGVSLTDAGRLLRDRATPLVRQLERVQQEVRDEYNEPSGELSLAIPPSMADLLTHSSDVSVQVTMIPTSPLELSNTLAALSMHRTMDPSG